MPMSTLTLLLSLHDVAPPHLPRLMRAEALFRHLGVTHVTYLVVPRYHHGRAVDEDPEFLGWCAAARPFSVHWCLHGYYHEEGLAGRRDRFVPRNWLTRSLLTAGEGEFLALRGAEARYRIDRGRARFKACLGQDPVGFVAPAWLFNRELMPALRERGFAWTEDHWRVIDVRRDLAIPAPVITWATRTPVRRHGSARLAPALLRFWGARRVIRIAVHPLDFDDGRLVEAITRTLATALRNRALVRYDDVLAPGSRA
jgi:predicted deacetylase